MLKTSKLGLISWTKDKEVKTNGRVPNSTVNGTMTRSDGTNLAPCFRVRLEKRHPVSDSKAKKYTLIGGTPPSGTYMALPPPPPPGLRGGREEAVNRQISIQLRVTDVNIRVNPLGLEFLGMENFLSAATSHLLKNVRGWQFLTIEAAETLCMVCLPPEKRTSEKDIWVTDLSKSHICKGLTIKFVLLWIF